MLLPSANEVWGKVILLHLFVILFIGGMRGRGACMAGGHMWHTHPAPRTPPPPDRYYWNAFLLVIVNRLQIVRGDDWIAKFPIIASNDCSWHVVCGFRQWNFHFFRVDPCFLRGRSQSMSLTYLVCWDTKNPPLHTPPPASFRSVDTQFIVVIEYWPNNMLDSLFEVATMSRKSCIRACWGYF